MKRALGKFRTIEGVVVDVRRPRIGLYLYSVDYTDAVFKASFGQNEKWIPIERLDVPVAVVEAPEKSQGAAEEGNESKEDTAVAEKTFIGRIIDGFLESSPFEGLVFKNHITDAGQSCVLEGTFRRKEREGEQPVAAKIFLKVRYSRGESCRLLAF